MGERREELAEKVIENVSKQTGIAFKQETRNMTIWHVIEER
jgi:hypothetical protein